MIVNVRLIFIFVIQTNKNFLTIFYFYDLRKSKKKRKFNLHLNSLIVYHLIYMKGNGEITL